MSPPRNRNPLAVGKCWPVVPERRRVCSPSSNWYSWQWHFIKELTRRDRNGNRSITGLIGENSEDEEDHAALESLLPPYTAESGTAKMEDTVPTMTRRSPSAWTQLKALLWKSWLTQKRKPFWTLAEILAPLVLTATLITVNFAVEEQHHPDTIYDPLFVHGDARDFILEYVDGLPMVSPTFTPTELYYAPKTPVTEVVIQKLVDKLKLVPKWAPANPCSEYIANAAEEWKSANSWQEPNFPLTSTAYDTAAALEHGLFDKMKSYSSNLYAGIIFDEQFANGKNTKNVTYTLRFPYEQRNLLPNMIQGSVVYTWSTNQFGINDGQDIHRQPNSSVGGLPDYWREGFLTLQRALDTVLTETLEPSSLCLMAMMDVQLTRFPFTAFVSHPLVEQFPLIMPSVMVVSFVLSLLYIARNLTVEKERNLVEYIQIVTGLSGWVQWSAHLVVNIIKFTIISGAMTTMLCLTVLKSSNPLLIFAFLFLFSLNVVAFGFFISAFFKGANNATLCAGVLWFLIFVPCLYAQRFYTELSRAKKMYFSLLAHGATVIGCQMIGNLEQKGVGLRWDSLLTRPTPADMAPYELYIFLVLDILPLFLLAVYVDAVKSGRIRWYCLCPCIGWCLDQSASTAANPTAPISFDSNTVEKTSVEGRPSIVIENVVKKYRDHNRNEIRALDHFSFFVQPGELTVILGHNGAGKTTLMRILTGCVKPSNGSVYINDKDISGEMNSIRHMLGYCPQYNTLFDCLTVNEHLRFYSQLKNGQTEETEKGQSISRMLTKLRLDKNKDTLARNLSGGQKRRLSLAVALVGGSRVILMDEPTSGMDPGAKGDVIDVLKQIKQPNISMVLVTHYVDEAELLGDRVAIISDGRLRCYGTNMFLKNRFGNGYRLTVSFGPVEPGKRIRTSVAASRVQESLDEICPGICRLYKTKGTEAVFLLNSSLDTVETCKQHQTLLYTLESLAEQLYIRSISVSMPSMQDVFMNSSSVDVRKDKTAHLNVNGEEEDEVRHCELALTTTQRNGGLSLFRQQFSASFKKRVLYTWRQKRLLFLQFIVLILCVGLGSVLNHLLRRHEPDMPPLELDVANYGPSIVPLALSFLNQTEDDNSTTQQNGLSVRIADRLIETFRSSVFVGSTLEELQSEVDMSEWLLDHIRQQGVSFTRSHLFAVQVSQQTYVNNDSEYRLFLLDGYFNPRATHSIGSLMNSLGNAVLKHFCPDCRIHAVNQPLPQTTILYYPFGDDFIIVLCYLVGMSFFCTSFAVSLVEERANGAKHCQLLAGLRLSAFWTANCIWDGMLYILACGVVILIWWLGGCLILAKASGFLYSGLILAAYGLALLPFTYALSFLHRTPASAMTVITTVNLLLGLAPTVTVAMLMHLSFDQDDLKDIEEIVTNVCVSIFPQFAMARSIMAYYNNLVMMEQCKAVNMCDWLEQSEDSYFRVTKNPLEWELPGVGRLVMTLVLQSLALFCLLLLIEWLSLRPSGWWSSGKSSGRVVRIDPNTMEMVRVDNDETAPTTEAILEIHDLTVRYNSGKPKSQPPAVDRLTFRVHQAEIFGLNGENGSGKTSTYKVLTGVMAPYNGVAILNGKNVRSSWRKATKGIGYCPQVDCLLERLTGREVLMHFARLRGLTANEVDQVVDGLLDALGLTKYANKIVKTYSGGNKRKVSLVLAVLGAPSVLLLDEPTCGVDPIGRRAIWKLLKYMKHRLRTGIVLTSHDMEECEALCDRMGILMKGRLTCIDTPGSIAEKYGCHYVLRLTVVNSGDLDDVEEAVFSLLPNAHLKAKPNSCQVHFTVPKSEEVTWSKLYRIVERLATQWSLSDFAISRASLQEAFVTVSRGEAAVVTDQL